MKSITSSLSTIKVRKGFYKRWREVNENYYLKSLDHQGRREENESITSRLKSPDHQGLFITRERHGRKEKEKYKA